MVTADIVEIDVDAVGCGDSKPFEDRSGLVIDDLLRPERAHELALLRAARRGDHCHALGFGDLDDDRTDRARRGGNKDNVARLRVGRVEKAEVSGRPGHAEYAKEPFGRYAEVR